MERPMKPGLSEYFELHTTLAKLQQMFDHMFATRFELITTKQQRDLGNNEPIIWHEDVLIFAVFDSDAEVFMGYAYFGFYHRDGRYTHIGHYCLQANFLQPDGTRFHASSVLVINYNKAADRPTLLSLGEVRKLFHEIGHLIHPLCTETVYAASQYVDRDFIEAPSLMSQQFFWQERHIKDVSFHYSLISSQYRKVWKASMPQEQRESADSLQPGAQLRNDVVAAMARSSTGWKIVREQLKDALEAMNLAESSNKLKSEIYRLAGGEAIDGWEWGHGEAVFRSVINNYDAGYYSYVLYVLGH
ncbi:hypothetical protein VMCG_10579 [Cytospora schulzeri]|uniref:Peptidase M3A/M3B catalytic domain-containing protein n=1 Tax=Cytospora schulzeri TaxID=448051 RepID=A0A423VAA2_9PEZI|nr:hypothetical protein VMCG_10579 [Valsa malicola]